VRRRRVPARRIAASAAKPPLRGAAGRRGNLAQEFTPAGARSATKQSP
jgi:hypothetical protein